MRAVGSSPHCAKRYRVQRAMPSIVAASLMLNASRRSAGQVLLLIRASVPHE